MSGKLDGIYIPAPLSRELTPNEKGALWLVACKILEIVESTGHGEIQVFIRGGKIDLVGGGDKTKRIPAL